MVKNLKNSRPTQQEEIKEVKTMQKTAIYIVRVTEEGDQFEYEYGLKDHAEEHLKSELIKGNLAELVIDTEY